jgi:hypothetical protein
LLRLLNLEEIQGLLLKLPSIVDLQEKRDPAFILRVKDWLSSLEKALGNNRMPLAGMIAGFRASLISAERGTMPEGVESRRHASGGNLKEAAAVGAVRKAANAVYDAVKPDAERVSEAERRVRQLVAVARSKGIINHIEGNINFTENLSNLWQSMAADSDICPGTIGVEGLIGPIDALFLLDRAIAADSQPEKRITEFVFPP